MDVFTDAEVQMILTMSQCATGRPPFVNSTRRHNKRIDEATRFAITRERRNNQVPKHTGEYTGSLPGITIPGGARRLVNFDFFRIVPKLNL